MKQSCELQRLAVSKLFFSLPIYGYAAINMSAIPSINDAVGGIDITPAYSFSSDSYSYTQDQSVHLDGSMAYDYLHYRDVSQAGSADLRLQRQKEYLMAYIAKALSMTKKNPMLMVNLFDTVKKQMVTDLSAQEVLFLSSTTLDYSFSDENLYLLKGYTHIGNTFEEFYPDNDELIRLMIEIFYEKKDTSS
jgi:anionic cell wall polymer biosynthesis LytR-Cps2A-Psr (LCP) family protein